MISAVMYVIAIVLLFVAAFKVTSKRVSLVVLAAAFALTAYAWPTLAALATRFAS